MDEVVETIVYAADSQVSLDSPSPAEPTFRVEDGDTLHWAIAMAPNGARVRIDFVARPDQNNLEPLLVEANLEAANGENLGGRVNPAAARGTYEYTFTLVSAAQSDTDLRVLHADGSITPKVSGIKDPKP